MTLGRTVSRGLVPLSVFALLGSGLVLGATSTAPTVSTVADAAGTDAEVREVEVPVVDPSVQEEEPEVEAEPDADAAAEPEAGEAPETLAAPEEHSEDDGHDHAPITDAAVVAELEPRELQPFAMLGVTWTGGLDEAGSRVEARWRSDGTWSAWTELHVEPSEGEGIPGTEPQWVGSADAAAVRVISSTGAQPRDLSLSTIDPGTAPDIAPAAFTTAATMDGVPQPRIISRAQWGASNSGSCDSPIYGPSTRGAVIHHTAGSNNYSKSQSASIVKATQAYHTGARSWCDIGYNFLIDKYGQIFEGRAGGIRNGVRAAHSGNGPVNQETVGVSLMGTFSTTAPTSAMKAAADDLVAWKFAVHGIPATGTFTSGGVRLNRISGHRNVVGTECPGNAAYAWVTSSMRPAVERRLADGGGVADTGYRWNAPADLSVGAATDTSLRMSWAAQSGAKKYVVKLSTSPTMSNPQYAAFSTSSGTFTGLAANTTYYAQVIIKHSSTNEALSPYSPVSIASTYRWAAPDGLTAARPTASSLAVSWDAQPGAAKYVVKYSRSADMSSPGYQAFSTSSGTLSGLRAGTTYYVQVIVKHSKTNEELSAYSTSTSARTSSSAPSTTAPSGYRWAAPAGLKTVKASSDSLDVSWAAQAGAAKYVVKISRSADMSNAGYRAFSTSSGTISGLRPSTTYYMQVIIKHSKTNEELSPYSSRVTTATVAPTPPEGYRWFAPTDLRIGTATSSSLAVSWTAQAGAKKYVVKISRNPDMSGAGYRAFSTSSGTISGLRAGTTYYLQVIIKHSTTNEALSPYSSKTAGATKASATNTQNSRTIGSASSVTFTGHGYGHGIGMSQYGARGGALQGKRASQILATYYPGTKIEKSARYIRVLVGADNDGSTAVVAQSGMRFLQGSTSIALPTTISGQSVSYWRIEPSSSDPRDSVLRYKTGSTWKTYQDRTWNGSADFSASTIRLALPGGGTTTYRYKIRAAQPSSSSTTRRTVNVLDLDDYTQGVVPREVPASWPTESLRSQSIAARTYGLRSISSGGYYDICDTTSCQVYGGVSAEDSRTNSAVASTSNLVLTYNGSPALTQFSSSSGGFTQSGSQPYLKAVADPWDGGVSGNPNHDWSQTVSTAAIERANPSIGSLQKVDVVTRNGHGEMGGRVVSLKLTGSRGTATISGPVARFAFGLKSDWFGF